MYRDFSFLKTSQIKLVCKYQPRTNALAYFSASSLTNENGFLRRNRFEAEGSGCGSDGRNSVGRRPRPVVTVNPVRAE